MKNFFEGIAWLFEEILFLPYILLRELESNKLGLCKYSKLDFSTSWFFCYDILDPSIKPF